MRLQNEFALGLSNEKIPQQIEVPLQKHFVEIEQHFLYTVFSQYRKRSARCDEL